MSRPRRHPPAATSGIFSYQIRPGKLAATCRLRDPVLVSLNLESSPLAGMPISAPLVLLPSVMLAFLPTPVAGMNGQMSGWRIGIFIRRVPALAIFVADDPCAGPHAGQSVDRRPIADRAADVVRPPAAFPRRPGRRPLLRRAFHFWPDWSGRASNAPKRCFCASSRLS